MTPNCPARICLCPCECSNVEPLRMHTYTHKYTYIIFQILSCMNPCCANSHMSVPLRLRVLTLWSSLYTYMFSLVFTGKHISCCRYLCIWTQVAQTHICLCPCQRSHLEPLCIHAYTHKYTFVICYITNTFVYEPMLCNLTYVCPLRVLTLRTLCLLTYIHKFTCMYYMIDTLVYEPMLCKLTYLCALASAHT